MKKYLVAVTAVVMLSLPVTAAPAASLITGGKVKNESLTGSDIKNGTVSSRDLGVSARNLLGAKPGPQGPTGATGATGATGTPGKDGSAAAKGEKGDKGDPGKNGESIEGPPGKNGSFNTTKIRTKSANSSGLYYASVNVECNDDETAISGSSSNYASPLTSQSESPLIEGSGRVYGWQATATGGDSYNNTVYVTATVICAK